MVSGALAALEVFDHGMVLGNILESDGPHGAWRFDILIGDSGQPALNQRPLPYLVLLYW